MTTEEAIKALRLMEHVESISTIYEPGEVRNDTTVRELKGACSMAIKALSAQTDFNGTYVNIAWLKQVEAERDALKAAQAPVKLDRSSWKGCVLCDGAKIVYGENVAAYLGRTEDGEHEAYAYASECEMDFDYCPICGKPITEEAWAELERRIGGNDGKID